MLIGLRCFLKDQSARRGRPFSDRHWIDEVPKVRLMIVQKEKQPYNILKLSFNLFYFNILIH